jgi:predicted RNA binding protein YcfA (HicA-like mRNA interferase family)
MPRLKRLSGVEVIKILEKFGFEVHSQRGDHVKMRPITGTGIDLEAGYIKNIQQQDSILLANSNSSIINCKGDWISLGGIDLQINGALG